jgi:hypothetical protein
LGFGVRGSTDLEEVRLVGRSAGSFVRKVAPAKDGELGSWDGKRYSWTWGGEGFGIGIGREGRGERGASAVKP